MSYELDMRYKVKCPCGKGLLVMELYSNDWHNYEEKYFVDCEECKSKYEIKKETVKPKPYHEHDFYYLIGNGQKFRIIWRTGTLQLDEN